MDYSSLKTDVMDELDNTTLDSKMDAWIGRVESKLNSRLLVEDMVAPL